MPLLQHFFLVAAAVYATMRLYRIRWESACESDGIESAWPAS